MLTELDALGWDFFRTGNSYTALRRAGTEKEEQGAATPDALLEAVRATDERLAALAESPLATSPEPPYC